MYIQSVNIENDKVKADIPIDLSKWLLENLINLFADSFTIDFYINDAGKLTAKVIRATYGGLEEAENGLKFNINYLDEFEGSLLPSDLTTIYDVSENKNFKIPVSDIAGTVNNMLCVKHVFTTAEFRALHTTPFEFVAAPGAGKIALAHALYMTKTAGDENYDFGSNPYMAIYYDINNWIYNCYISSNNYGGTPIANMSSLNLMIGSTINNVFDIENKPLKLWVRTQDSTVGNHIITIYLFYSISTLITI